MSGVCVSVCEYVCVCMCVRVHVCVCVCVCVCAGTLFVGGTNIKKGVSLTSASIICVHVHVCVTCACVCVRCMCMSERVNQVYVCQCVLVCPSKYKEAFL